MNSFSNSDRDVFVIKLQRMIDRGALMSRYSRTANLDLRDVFEKEFETNPDRGRDFYRRVFTEYGDESIAELVTAQLGIQNISNVATKVIEESRIGLSYLEKSSRYVNYDVKRDGKYLYLHADAIGLQGNLAIEYDDFCDSLFECYSSIRSPLETYLKEKYPYDSVMAKDLFRDNNTEEKVLRKSYDRSVRSRAFDEVRNLLPSSTLTNMGISGNGRAFLSMIMRLRKYGLKELRSLSDAVFNELREELPELIDNANTDYSLRQTEYEKKRDYCEETGEPEKPDFLIRLLNCEDEDTALMNVSRARAYQSSSEEPLHTDPQSRGDMVSAIMKEAEMRKNRRHKPGRWYEFTSYSFEIATNFGSFRDLQRHRMMTVIRKRITPAFGYEAPPSISEIPDIRNEYEKMMNDGAVLWKKIRKEKGEEVAQYAVPFGYTYPVLIHTNLRELCYFTELRSTPQAHYDLRHISQQMHTAVKKVHPSLSEIIKFVDPNEYIFGRLRSEIRKEEKLKKIEDNGAD